MRITVIPQTKLGRWAVGLFIAATLFFGAATSWPGLVHSPDLPDFRVAPVFSTLICLGFAACISASFVGLRSITRHHERALLVYASIPLGIFYLVGIVVMLVAFLLFPGG